MRRNTPLADLHVITATNHLQRRSSEDLQKSTWLWSEVCGRVTALQVSGLLPTLCPQMGYARTPLHLSSQEIDAAGSCSDHVIQCSVHLQHHGVKLSCAKLFISGFVFVGAWRPLGGLYVVPV